MLTQFERQEADQIHLILKLTYNPIYCFDVYNLLEDYSNHSFDPDGRYIGKKSKYYRFQIYRNNLLYVAGHVYDNEIICWQEALDVCRFNIPE